MAQSVWKQMHRSKVVVKTKTRILYSVTFFKFALIWKCAKLCHCLTIHRCQCYPWPFSDIVIGSHDKRMCNVLFHIYIYVYTHTHTHTHTRINFDMLSNCKSELEFWCKSSRLQWLTFHNSLSYNITTSNISYTVP